MKLKIYLSLLLFSFLSGMLSQGAEHPKREFRGAWIHTVGQSRYMEMNRDAMQDYFDQMLDSLQHIGINAVIFQVRPTADAFYRSELEPWSKYLTGKQGVAPEPLWDPLQYIIEQCHARNMELHAWLNPYRVGTNADEPLAASHIYENSYARYGNGMDRGDWRRENVNALIKELHEIIKSRKPWVRFGISPFGIYRNQKSDPDGSATNGLQNYDQLYADVLLWTRNGWVDYMLPQLYWEIGHQAACVETLIYWWNNHANGRHLYIGQDVARTMNATDVNPIYTQLNHKMQLSRYLDHVGGNCFWPGYSLLENYKGIADDLKGYYHAVPALIPAYTFIDSKAPDEVKGLKAKWTPEGYELQWKRKKTDDEMQKQIYFCVYRFAPSEDICLCDASHLVAVTRDTKFLLPYKHGTRQYVYVVTAVDRMHNESKGKIKKVKL